MQREWLISRICEEYGCLPSSAQRELDRDPERLAIKLLDLRAYSAAKQAFDRARDKVDDLKQWEGNPHMTLVETHTYELHLARASQRDKSPSSTD